MNGQVPEGLILASLDDGEDFELSQQFTIGRHHDNDLTLIGTDLLDHHARGQLDERGIHLIPLNNSSFQVNGLEVAEPWRLVPDDILKIGSLRFEVTDLAAAPKDALDWTVHYKGEEVEIQSGVTIGRGSSAGISFNNAHISREHARLFVSTGNLWLLDLNSANGTFVNGKRLRGGCRLFHGDELSFDQLAMQVIGHGQDLTPARKRKPADLVAPLPLDPGALDPMPGTIEMQAIQLPDEMQNRQPESPGCYLIGQAPPVSGAVFALRFGTTAIGREGSADINIDEPSVSARHAEITYRADGVAIANLFSTNGTRVNGQAVDSVVLEDGDLITVGNVSFLLRETLAADAPVQASGWIERLLRRSKLLFHRFLVQPLLQSISKRLVHRQGPKQL